MMSSGSDFYRTKCIYNVLLPLCSIYLKILNYSAVHVQTHIDCFVKRVQSCLFQWLLIIQYIHSVS